MIKYFLLLNVTPLELTQTYCTILSYTTIIIHRSTFLSHKFSLISLHFVCVPVFAKLCIPEYSSLVCYTQFHELHVIIIINLGAV